MDRENNLKEIEEMFDDQSNSISSDSLVNIDEDILENSVNFNPSNNNESISQEEVKKAIEANFSHNKDLTNMFNQGLYTKLNEELNNMNLDEEALTHGSR